MRQYPWQFMTLSAWAVAVVVLLTPVHALPSSGQQMAVTGVTGSGFVVSPDGYILTNQHVIHGAEEITVYIGATSYRATVVTASEGSDLALLKVPVRGLTPVRLGNSLLVELLEPVVAMGYPLAGYGRDLTTSQGEITAIRTNVPSREGRDTLQHDAVITHGSSGGPLFNALGEVIGVNFAGVEGAGLQFAIPIADAIPLLRNIPGFNPRDMGTATATVPASQIVSTYRAAVVFIDCTVEIAWGAFLPDPKAVAGFPNEAEIAVSGTGGMVEWLAERRFNVIGGAALTGSSVRIRQPDRRDRLSRCSDCSTGCADLAHRLSFHLD